MDIHGKTIEILENTCFEPYNNAPLEQTVGYLLVKSNVEEIIKSAQQSVHLTALRRGLAVSILLNVVLLAALAYSIGGR